MDIAEVLKRANTPEEFVDVCLDANLRAQHRSMEKQLQEAHRETGKSGDARRRELAEQIRDLEGRMQAATVTFHIRGLSAYDRDEWLAAHPPREGKQEAFNPVAGEPALVAACCVDPQMSAEDAAELRKKLGGDWDRLAKAAWDASTEGSSVPFSFIASAVLRPPSAK